MTGRNDRAGVAWAQLTVYLYSNMRKIIHIDMDCFFAAVEMRDNLALREVLLAIGGSADRRGVISTCNYVARRFWGAIRHAERWPGSSARRWCSSPGGWLPTRRPLPPVARHLPALH